MAKVLWIVLLALFLSSNAFSDWALVNDQSDINFISTKKSKVSEINHFKAIEGVIDDSGALSIDIDLASVETNIPIRNERMQTMLFNVAKYAKANITATIDLAKIKALGVGDVYTDTVSFTLNLHGFSQEISSDVNIVKLSDNRLMTVSTRPIVINAEDFGLVEGIEALRKIAQLPSISTAVPVTFSFVFSQ